MIMILGLLQKYWALRVAFDADLFALLARDTAAHHRPRPSPADPRPAIAQRAGRPSAERRRGALKLLRKQAWLLGAQALLTLGVILASPWLPFAG